MIRIGMGYDVHRLVEGRPLILGGVTIPHDRGLLGHSDADVLAHAVADALLGAAALGDIGQHYPDTDDRWRGADSLVLLHDVGEKVAAAGYRISNLDVTVALEQPRLRPHVMAMRRRVSQALGLSEDQVSIKATTTERLGFVGQGAGAAAYAVCLIESADRSATL